ncbi:hypothetical protein SNE40_009739 [Patella caerulea]|uniref:PiggyBac transposable element-derived protein domain-containing protein n=1 Tax=Patella caerulea TaxID=87958 RepID=A0AAN8PSI1_PATCE
MNDLQESDIEIEDSFVADNQGSDNVLSSGESESEAGSYHAQDISSELDNIDDDNDVSSDYHGSNMSNTSKSSDSDESITGQAQVKAPVIRGGIHARGRGRGRARVRGNPGRGVGNRGIVQPDRQWTDITVNDIGPTHHRFTPEDDPGPRHIDHLMDNEPEAVDFFKLFFDDDLMTKLVTEINRYAAEKIQNTILKPKSRLRKWKDTNTHEMYRFIGILLNMGIVKKPYVDSYWTGEWTSAVPLFRDAMDRDRFSLIFHTMLHVAHSDRNEPVPQRGAKI